MISFQYDTSSSSYLIKFRQRKYHPIDRKIMVQPIRPQLDDYLLGVGHPLLDINVNVDDKFLARYNLKADDGILAGPQHDDLIEYCFQNYQNQFKLVAGGAAQNSIRTAQWVFDFYELNSKTLSLGTVGDDQYADMLEEQAKKDNVEPLYCRIKKPIIDNNNNDSNQIENIESEKNPLIINKKQDVQQLENKKTELEPTQTGICLAFNTNNGLYRSMVTFLGAAREFKSEHVDTHMQKIDKCSLVYCGGFLLSSSFDAVVKLGEFCHEKNKKFALNLSAPYICSKFGDLIGQLIPNLDLIFGNEKELREFGNYHKFQTDDLEKIAMKIFDKFTCKKKEQIIVITQNKDAVLCFLRSSREGFKQYVPKIDKEEIVDTIGGGDAFAGAFLAYYLMNKDLDLCLKCGIYCARQIIQKVGCNFDDIKFNEQDLIDLFNPKS